MSGRTGLKPWDSEDELFGGARLEWTRLGAWWNAEFTKTGLSTNCAVYRICQAMEARLGIHQGSVSPPDYRDYLADLP
jgi:hypothetical protein